MYAIDSGSLWTRRLVNLKILGPLFWWTTKQWPTSSWGGPETNSHPKFPKISVEVQKSISGEKIEKGGLSKKNIRYLEPQYLLFLKVNPFNTRPFQSKTRVMFNTKWRSALREFSPTMLGWDVFVLLIFNLRVHGYEISRLSNSASRGKQWRYHPRTLHKKVVEGWPLAPFRGVITSATHF